MSALPALAGNRDLPAAPRQILRPLPLDIVDVVWQADGRQEGLAFRVYRDEGGGRATLLGELPVRLGLHRYRLKDVPPGERQRYELRLIDAEGHENPLRTIELVGYHRMDPDGPLPGSVHPPLLSLPCRAAQLPRPAKAPVFELQEKAPGAGRATEPPDPPPDAARGLIRFPSAASRTPLEKPEWSPT